MSDQAAPTSIVEIIRRRAEVSPDVLALVSEEEKTSYGQLLHHSSLVNELLRDLGIGRHDRVALVLPNGPRLAAAFLAVASSSVCAPLNPAYTRRELAFYLSDLQASALVTASTVDSPARELANELGLQVIELEGLAAAQEPAAPEPDADEVALMLHTSGTTARPKLVPLSHRNLCASARNVASTLALSANDRSLNVMPLFHIHGLVGVLLASLWSGGSVVCTTGFHAPSFVSWLEDWAPTWYSAVPTMHQSALIQAIDAGREIGHVLRFIRSSSAGLPVTVLDGLEETFGVPVVEAYGMTEAAHQMASNGLAVDQRRRGSVGRAAGPEVTVLAPDGTRLSAGEVGEVAIRGENVFSGYEANPDANAEAFAHDWFRTGDEGRLDANGFLFLHGRIKEIINRGGEKISPAEVEGVLLEHPGVAQVAVFAVPDDLLGEEVGAAIVLEAAGKPPSTRELQTFVAHKLADFKVPRSVAFIDELPKGPTGKVQRIGLADRLGVTSKAAPSSEAYTPPRNALEAELTAMVEDVLQRERVGVRDDFFALGGDSLLAAVLVAHVREAYDRPHFPLSALVWAPTIEKLAREIEGETQGASSSLAVTLRPGGDRTPLFFVHAVDGEIVRYVALARRLDSERPFVAIRARGADGDEAPHQSLAEMIADYVAAVREHQPEGPYVLGGVCLGGTLAIEMARQLEALGEDVALVILVDPRVNFDRSLRWLRAQAGLIGRKVVSGDYSWKLARASHRRKVFEAVRSALGVGVRRDDPYRRDFDDAILSIRAECGPSRFDGFVAMLATVDYPLREWFWKPYLPRLNGVEDLPFRHRSLLREPGVDALASAVDDVLRRLAR